MIITDDKDIHNSKSVVLVKCDYCGHVSSTTYRNFIKGRVNIDKDSCKKCVGKKCADITLKKRQNNFYNKILSVCEENGYVLNTNKEEIKNNKTYITYTCIKHGKQKMRIGNFLSGKTCPLCNRENSSIRNRFKEDYVIKEVRKCNGDVVNPNEYINNHTKNLDIKCPSCGNVFKTSLVLFTQHGGQVCAKCSSRESIGEIRIRKFLESKDIEFLQEFKFEDCRDINHLQFDFYLPNYNVAIEFDGRQHFEETNIFSYGLDKTKYHDDIKNKYCINKGIEIIRISYKKINSIEKILNEKFT